MTQPRSFETVMPGTKLASRRTLIGLRSKKQKMPGRLEPADASLLLKYSLTLYWLVLTVTFLMFVYVVGTTCGGADSQSRHAMHHGAHLLDVASGGCA